MKPEVLVAYCTRSGSTAEVAQAIGKTIKDAGLRCRVKSIAEVESIPAGTVVVLGTALYIGHFPKEFHQFVGVSRRNSRIAAVDLCPRADGEGAQALCGGGGAGAEGTGQASFASPGGHAGAGGQFRSSAVDLPFPMSLMMKVPANPMRKLPVSDIRDWDWIHRWAEAIAEEITTRV